MKKVLFLMFLLLLIGLGAANVKAQVRIGGNIAPNTAAALDLNATDTTTNGTKGLALPRVNLTSSTMQLTTGVANLTGMLVYNTSASMTGGSGEGMYFWDGSSWTRVTPYVPNPSGTVRWVMSLDTTFIIGPIGAYGYVSVIASSVKAFDICDNNSNILEMLVFDNAFTLYHFQGAAVGASSISIRCFRATTVQ